MSVPVCSSEDPTRTDIYWPGCAFLHSRTSGFTCKFPALLQFANHLTQ